MHLYLTSSHCDFIILPPTVCNKPTLYRVPMEIGKPEKLKWSWKNHGKVMEHEKLAKSHRMLLSVMEYYQFSPELYRICIFFFFFFATTKKLSMNVGSPHFLKFSSKCPECKIDKRDGHGKLRNGHGQIFCQVSGKPALPCTSEQTVPHFSALFLFNSYCAL